MRLCLLLDCSNYKSSFYCLRIFNFFFFNFFFFNFFFFNFFFFNFFFFNFLTFSNFFSKQLYFDKSNRFRSLKFKFFLKKKSYNILKIGTKNYRKNKKNFKIKTFSNPSSFAKFFKFNKKTFFFLKNIKPSASASFSLINKNNTNRFFFTPLYSFFFFLLLKKNIINLVGLTHFKNYYKIPPVANVKEEIIEKNKRIKFWKKKKLVFFLKQKLAPSFFINKEKKINKIFFLIKKLLKIFFFKKNIKKRNQINYLKFWNLTSEPFKSNVDEGLFFYTSPLRYLFFKKKTLNIASRSVKTYFKNKNKKKFKFKINNFKLNKISRTEKFFFNKSKKPLYNFFKFNNFLYKKSFINYPNSGSPISNLSLFYQKLKQKVSLTSALKFKVNKFFKIYRIKKTKYKNFTKIKHPHAFPMRWFQKRKKKLITFKYNKKNKFFIKNLIKINYFKKFDFNFLKTNSSGLFKNNFKNKYSKKFWLKKNKKFLKIINKNFLFQKKMRILHFKNVKVFIKNNLKRFKKISFSRSSKFFFLFKIKKNKKSHLNKKYFKSKNFFFKTNFYRLKKSKNKIILSSQSLNFFNKLNFMKKKINQKKTIILRANLKKKIKKTAFLVLKLKQKTILKLRNKKLKLLKINVRGIRKKKSRFFRFKNYLKNIKFFFFKQFYMFNGFKKKIILLKRKNFLSRTVYHKPFGLFLSKNLKFKNIYFLPNLLKKKFKLSKDFLLLSKNFNNFFFKNFFFTSLYSRIDFPLNHSFNGFLYIDFYASLSFYRKENVWMVRKLVYSFKSKNFFKKFLLKKYLQNFYTSVLSSEISARENYYFKTPYDFNFPFDYLDKKPENGLFFEENTFAFSEIYSSSFFQKKINNFCFNIDNTAPFSIIRNCFDFINWDLLPEEIRFMENISSKESNPFYIKKIQFKPGYSSMWRGFRSLLKTSLNISFRYQHQLTKYLLKFNKIIRNRLYYLFEMQLDNILTLSKFFPDRSWSNFFITEGAIFINGAKTKNYLEQVFVNDFIQLAVSCKYYITYRWLMTWQITKKNKFKYRLNKKWNVRHADDKQKSKNLPLWLLKNKNLNEDVPLYSEVDYFTLSCFIITEPFFFNDIDAISFLSKPFSIINLFNWKYIN